jgi:hypothetical protein
VKIQRFKGQITQCKALLKRLELYHRSIPEPDYTSVASVKKSNYLEQWTYYLRNNLYDFLLVDWSIFQFELLKDGGEDKYRYVYLENPYQAVQSFGQYCNVSRTLGRADLESQYFSYLEDDCEVKEHVRPIRYDYTPLQYKRGLHPASHFHLGCINEFRLSTRKLMRPIGFTLFVARHIYPEYWEPFLTEINRNQYADHVRNRLTGVNPIYFCEDDEMELHLS